MSEIIMDKANKAIKEKYRVAVRKGLFQKLKERCTGRRTIGQCDILQAAIDVSNYVRD